MHFSKPPFNVGTYPNSFWLGINNKWDPSKSNEIKAIVRIFSCDSEKKSSFGTFETSYGALGKYLRAKGVKYLIDYNGKSVHCFNLPYPKFDPRTSTLSENNLIEFDNSIKGRLNEKPEFKEKIFYEFKRLQIKSPQELEERRNLVDEEISKLLNQLNI